MAYSGSCLRISSKILPGLLLIIFASAPLSSREKKGDRENEPAASLRIRPACSGFDGR